MLLLLLLLSHFSRVRLCPAPWTAAYQAPPPMGFSRQQYWSGLPLPSLKQCYICYKNMTKVMRVMCKWLESAKQYIKMSGFFFPLFSTLNMTDSFVDWETSHDTGSLSDTLEIVHLYLFFQDSVIHLIFGCAGPPLLCAGLVWLWQVGATRLLRSTGSRALA